MTSEDTSDELQDHPYAPIGGSGIAERCFMCSLHQDRHDPALGRRTITVPERNQPHYFGEVPTKLAVVSPDIDSYLFGMTHPGPLTRISPKSPWIDELRDWNGSISL